MQPPHGAPHVTPHVGRLIAALQGDMSRGELMDALGLRDRRHFARAYLQPFRAGNVGGYHRA